MYANPNVLDFSSADYKNAGIKRYGQSGFLFKDV